MVNIIIVIIAIALFIYALPFLLLGLGIYFIYKLILNIRKNKYFKSNEFLEHKEKVKSMVNEYNEIAEYVQSIPNKNKFIPDKNKHQYSDIARFENTSKHKYKRDRNIRTIDDDSVYPASLQIVKRASEEPIKYFSKYFNIEITDESLDQLDLIGENISRMENTITNLNMRQEKIKDDFNPPKFIVKHFHKELMDKIGMQVPSIEPEYMQYIFEYISPGGNSSQRTIIDFDSETVEAASKFVAEKLEYKKSAKGQRALMTKVYRERIKTRDDYICQMCGASVAEQSLLLLEVDHIIPISKGGKSVDNNLQTLCWKCNRTKSDKIIISRSNSVYGNMKT